VKEQLAEQQQQPTCSSLKGISSGKKHNVVNPTSNF
jgi:hypothetical protein